MSSSHASAASRAHNAEQIRLPDGRTLAYCLYGPEDGSPVLFEVIEKSAGRKGVCDAQGRL